MCKGLKVKPVVIVVPHSIGLFLHHTEHVYFFLVLLFLIDLLDPLVTLDRVDSLINARVSTSEAPETLCDTRAASFDLVPAIKDISKS